MPYKFETDKVPMPRDKDRRVKLTDEERQQIRDLAGVYGAEKTGKLYGVSKRLVQFIRDPEKCKRNLECREARGGSSIYYNKDKHRQTMREHRRYKKQVLDADINYKKEG